MATAGAMLLMSRSVSQMPMMPLYLRMADSTTRSVAENTASEQNVGSAVAATDVDSGDTLTYTLSGTDAAAFGIVKHVRATPNKSSSRL